MAEQKTAFVVGATGYTGREVVRLTCQQGLNCVAHIRPDSPHLKSWSRRFQSEGARIDTTPWDEKALAKTLIAIKPDFVFSLIGTTRARMRELKQSGYDGFSASYEKVDYGLTAILIKACVAAGIHPKFIYLSSAGVDAKAVGAYLKARFKAEELLKASGLPYIIARPAIITGPDRDEPRPLEQVSARVLDQALKVAKTFGAKKLHARYHSTTNSILAKALLKAALDDGKTNQILASEDLRG